jgi:hypothetical protein
MVGLPLGAEKTSLCVNLHLLGASTLDASVCTSKSLLAY